MDPAEAELLKQALSSKGGQIGQLDATLVKVLDTLQQLTINVNSGFEMLVTQHLTSDIAPTVAPAANLFLGLRSPSASSWRKRDRRALLGVFCRGLCQEMRCRCSL